jgi:signal transduction histidine kinase
MAPVKKGKHENNKEEYMSGLVNKWRYWLSSSVLLIGGISIALLIWVDLINERLDTDDILVDAIMDVEINIATVHLWLEQAIAGDTEVDVKKVMADLDHAINLMDATLIGGESENNFISVPLQDPERRVSAEEIKTLLVRFRMMALERLRSPEKSGISSASDRQFDTVFKEVLRKARELEEIIERGKKRNYDKSRRLFSGILVIWTLIIVSATLGLRRFEVRQKRAEEALLKANEQLRTQTEELTGHREHLEELVEKRTAELTTAVRTLKASEKRIRSLSSTLLNAQEIERKRISMELHDELGQALNAAKLNVMFIKEGLREDQRPIREECEGLLEYLDQVIEDVRRLSLDLSPVVLEELGLTSALKRLINNLAKKDVKIVTDIEEIDKFLLKNYWITVYRIVQEALTNIVKHSQAENVSVVIARNDDKVNVSVEDDGKGFDPVQVLIKSVSETGLGLTTMNERVRMIGGDLEVWSQQGKGTRISFSIPIEKGEA